MYKPLMSSPAAAWMAVEGGCTPAEVGHVEQHMLVCSVPSRVAPGRQGLACAATVFLMLCRMLCCIHRRSLMVVWTSAGRQASRWLVATP